MASTLVTGGAGFIGSHVAQRLVELGHRVRVLDNFSTGNAVNLVEIRERIDLLEADVRDARACELACEGVDYVFHQAAIPSVPKSVDDPQASHDANINGTFNLLRAAVVQKVRRFIYAGSSSAYGESPDPIKHEGILPLPLSPYAVQKLTGELYARAFCECYRLETISLRYFNVFGARQDPASEYAAAIPAFITKILRGAAPVVYGDGSQTRDFTFIDNVVHGNMLAMEAAKTGGEAVNVACGESISVNGVIEEIQRRLGSAVTPTNVRRRPGDVVHSCADIRLAKELLGYEPLVGFGEGLTRTIDYYKTVAEQA